MYNDFYEGCANLECINQAFIVLIAKTDTPKNIVDFYLIGLINSLFKIISKILASRLSTMMNELVDATQIAFMKGKCIENNIVKSEELIFQAVKVKPPWIHFQNGFHEGL